MLQMALSLQLSIWLQLPIVLPAEIPKARFETIVTCRCITGTAEKWLDEFFIHCKNCRVDFMTAHIYTCNVDAVKSHVQSLALRYKRPVWLTEFNCLNERGRLAKQINFMQRALEVCIFVLLLLHKCACVPRL